jgi:DNA replicative helicase MCM subunit Mcm2 (Cdc46/Mcm family)/intein/homing endonuclease
LTEDEYKYRKRLGHVALSGSRSIVVDFEDLIAFDPELARFILDKPDEYLEYLGRSAWAQLKIEDPEYAEIIKKLRVRFRKLPEKHSLRMIGSENIARMLCIDGIIVRSTSVKPLLIKAAFQCRKCNAMTYVEQAGVLMRGPGVCPHCRSKVFEFMEKQSTFMNSQEIQIQERPEDLPPGQLPRAMHIKLSEDLVDIARPGDRVSITGIARAQQEYVGRKARLRTFDLLLDANYVDVVGKEVEVVEITPEDERQIRELAKDPFIHRKLIASLAPSIYGYGDIKEAVLYLLFGGVGKRLPDGVTIRSEINVLLVGDPGVAKSQLLQYVSRIAPRGLYTSGRGTTAAGLTAAVVREKSGGMVLEAGALVLADKGIACLTSDVEVYTGDRIATVSELWNVGAHHKELANGQEVRSLFCPVTSYYGEQRLDVKSYTNKIVRRKYDGSIVKIEFKSGLSIKLTPEHLVRSSRSSKRIWVPAKTLQPNDLVKAPKSLCKPLILVPVGEEIAYTLGCIYGDGYVNPEGITITQSRNNEHIITNMQTLSPYKFARYDAADKIKYIGEYVLVERASRLWTSNKELLEIYNSTIGNSLDTILRFDDSDLAAFLAGVFDSDGNLNSVKGKLTSVKLAPTVNEHHLSVLLYALRRLEIRGALRRSRRNPNVHIIQISGTSMVRFIDQVIPWSVKAKIAKNCQTKSKKPHLGMDEEQVKSVNVEHYVGYVYDLCVREHHNFAAAGIYVHNCIDEMDKMRPEDRVAIHEALEQHSYHPQTEILLASGRKVKIGEFVDSLFVKQRSQKVRGRDCEILSVKGQGISLITTKDFRTLDTIEVDRVSRHAAPKHFVEITYSNGRRVTVTPEHPVYVFRDGEIRTVAACKLQTKDFAPGPRRLEPLAAMEDLVAPSVSHHNEKTITLPRSMSEDLATILGYLMTEGYSYRGSAAEIGFANTDASLFLDMDSAMERTFKILPLDYSKINRTHRYISSRLYKYCSQNFPGLIKKARQKRLPAQLMNAPVKVAVAFLRSAFRGDGSVEPTTLAYCTSSKGLAEDYQDLLLRLGIFSRIFTDKASYKTYVTGDSLRRFAQLVVSKDDKRYEKVMALVDRSKAQRGHDVVPTDACTRLIEIQRLLGIRNDGYFWRHIKEGNGITRHVLDRRIATIEHRLDSLQRAIPEAKSIRQLRALLSWSQSKAGRKLGLHRGTIDYAERGGYTDSARASILKALRESASETISQGRSDINELRALSDLRWIRITAVRMLANEGQQKTPWVYDVTVEPTHNFVSHGVILHNTVSVAKGGIVATLNARAAVLAAANPSLGRYDPYRNITDNINLPVTLLSRFDLLFIMKDVPEPDSDSRMSEHILTLHRLKTTPEEPPLVPELLRKYIAYAKRIEPALTEGSVNAIRQYYLKMRSLSGSTESPIVITPRQLEGLVRLAEARARSFLRDRVEAEDAQAIIRLMTLSLQDVGIDTTTGKIDIDVIMTGKPKSLRDKMQDVLGTFADLEKQLGIVEDSTLYQALARKPDITEDDARRLVDQLVKEGILYSPKPGHLKRTAA